MFVIAAFYHFFDFSDFKERRSQILGELTRNNIKGSILISPEGMNATVAGPRDGIDKFLTFLKSEITGGTLEHKESYCEQQPFKRPKVRLKKETISLGVPPPLGGRPGGGHIETPSVQCPHPNPPPNGEGTNKHWVTGHYVAPKDWNKLISDPETIVLDTRNSYETHLGTFENAIDPNIRTFKHLPDFIRHQLADAKHKKIATFCTGGIRCEKFTPWLIEQGFENVYQLKGGILKYLEEVPEEQSKWRGECFVFDSRVAVGHGLVPSQDASICLGCGHTLLAKDKKHPLYKEGEQCGFCEMKRAS